ncbi:endonuclease VII domain-containing protein [Streptomyces violascens]|uniref:endonuclease VII domain-containing protein n=1 Tax=Streptomyces violascens TaxID=67381 RepID=UPI0036C27F23
MSEARKRCRDCGKEKPLDGFHRKSKASDGRQERCKPCAIALVIQWQRENPARHYAKQRSSDLKRHFGMTPKDVEAMFDRQGRACAICHEPEGPGMRVVLDHCHISGHARGLLCSLCNTGLGMFQDDITKLARAAAYLDR